jgi:transcriptional regulator with XRE-family HTH domain
MPVQVETADTATVRLCRRVRQLRQARRWTLEQLAGASGVSRSMLSQIERQQVNPTFHVAYRIAQAFGMSLGQLVGEDDSAPSIEVIRAHDEHYHFRQEHDHSVRTLYPMHLEKDVEFYEVKLRPGGKLCSSPHLTGTREFLTLQKGRIRVRSGEQSVILEAGDSARYLADVDHAIENLGRGEALAFLVAIYHPAAT